MASSKFNICSKALIELGEDPISSFQDVNNLKAAQICGEIWDDYARFILSVHSWRFTMKKQQLGRLVDAPLNQWQYDYQLPTDLLNLRAIFDSNSIGAAPYLGYQRFGNSVYSNAQTLYADYQAYVEPNFWPPYFVKFAVMALAADLAPPITNSVDIADRKFLKAWGLPQDNLEGGLFGKAKRIDSQQMPVEPITHFELIEARFS